MLGKDGGEHASAISDHLDRLVDKIFYLAGIITLLNDRAHVYQRIDKTGRANDLLHHRETGRFRFFIFVFARSGGGIETLSDALFEFFKLKRPIVFGGRQTESELHQGVLARAVPGIHAADLRDGHV